MRNRTVPVCLRNNESRPGRLPTNSYRSQAIGRRDRCGVVFWSARERHGKTIPDPLRIVFEVDGVVFTINAGLRHFQAKETRFRVVIIRERHVRQGCLKRCDDLLTG
jgi:hypothetical protein